MSVNFGLKATKIIGQRKAFHRQRIPEFSCARKETVERKTRLDKELKHSYISFCSFNVRLKKIINNFVFGPLIVILLTSSKKYLSGCHNIHSN